MTIARALVGLFLTALVSVSLTPSAPAATFPLTRQWRSVRSLGGELNVAYNAAGFDDAGNLYAVGFQERALTLPAGGLAYVQNLLLTCFGTAGEVRWQATIDGTPDLQVAGKGIAVDPDGTSFVTGSRGSSLMIARFNHRGALVWQRTAGTSPAAGTAILRDGNSGLFVTGIDGPKLYAALLDRDGTMRWERRFAPIPSVSRYGGGRAAIDADGGLLMTASFSSAGLLLKVSAAGILRWYRILAAPLRGIAASRGGGSFVTTGKSLVRFGPRGGRLWQRDLVFPDLAGLSLTRDGELAATGHQMSTMILDLQGTMLWVDVPGPDDRHQSAGIVSGPGGALAVVGSMMREWRGVYRLDAVALRYGSSAAAACRDPYAFHDSFGDAASLADDWHVPTGAWEISPKGVLLPTEGAPAVALAGSICWNRTASLELRFKFPPGTGEVDVGEVFAWTGPGIFNAVRARPTGIDLSVAQEGVVASVPVAIARGSWHLLRVDTGADGSVKVFLDGALSPILGHRLARPDLNYGRVGCAAPGGSGVAIDEFKAWGGSIR